MPSEDARGDGPTNDDSSIINGLVERLARQFPSLPRPQVFGVVRSLYGNGRSISVSAVKKIECEAVEWLTALVRR